jgi:NADPH2:quinone reductase
MTMVSAIRFSQCGNPEVLNLETLSEKRQGKARFGLSRKL